MGMKSPTKRVSFEKKVVVDGNTKRIDVYIPETHVLIEQAGKGLLEPRELITPEEISSKTLASMDQAIRNFKLGQVSNPVDLSDF